jgi:hypothetical protein
MRTTRNKNLKIGITLKSFSKAVMRIGSVAGGARGGEARSRPVNHGARMAVGDRCRVRLAGG